MQQISTLNGMSENNNNSNKNIAKKTLFIITTPYNNLLKHLFTNI